MGTRFDRDGVFIYDLAQLFRQSTQNPYKTAVELASIQKVAPVRFVATNQDYELGSLRHKPWSSSMKAHLVDWPFALGSIVQVARVPRDDQGS
jgi:hypothetical protein